MATNDNLIPIPGRLHSVASDGVTTGADEIFDDTLNKDQATINQEVNEAIGTGGSVDSRISAAINALDASVSKSAGADGLALSVTEENGKVTAINGSIAANTYDAYGAASVAQSAAISAAATDATTKVNAAKSEIKGSATSACDTLGEAEAKINANASAISAETSRAQAKEAQLQAYIEALSKSQPKPKTAEEWAAMTSWEEGVIYRVAGTTSYADWMYNGTTTIKMAEYDNAIDEEPTAGSDNLVKSGGVEQRCREIENNSGYSVLKTYVSDGGRLNTVFDREIVGDGYYKITFVSSTNDAVASFRVYRRNGTTTIGTYDTLSLRNTIKYFPIESNVDNFWFYTQGTITEGVEVVVKVEFFGLAIDGNIIDDNSIGISKIKPADIDSSPIKNSQKLIYSGGVKDYVDSQVINITGYDLEKDVEVASSDSRIAEYIENMGGFAGKEAKIKINRIAGDDISYIMVSFRNSGNTEISNVNVYLDTEDDITIPVGTDKILLFRNYSFTQSSEYLCKIHINGMINVSDVNSLFVGKKIVSFGDSIWEFTDSNNKGIIDYLKELSGNDNIFKGAIGGSRLVVRRTPVENPTDAYGAYAELDISYLVNAWATNSWTAVDNAVTWLKNNTEDDNSQIIQNLKSCPIESADIVLITGGANDHKSGVALGTPSDTPSIDTTSCAALLYAIKSILSVNPKIKVFYMSPIVRYVENTNPPQGENWSDVWENTNGVTLATASDTLRNAAKTLHTPSCDLYWELGWNKINFLEFFNSTDLTHPYKGFKQIAQKVYTYLISHL